MKTLRAKILVEIFWQMWYFNVSQLQSRPSVLSLSCPPLTDSLKHFTVFLSVLLFQLWHILVESLTQHKLTISSYSGTNGMESCRLPIPQKLQLDSKCTSDNIIHQNSIIHWPIRKTIAKWTPFSSFHVMQRHVWRVWRNWLQFKIATTGDRKPFSLE